MSYIFQLTKDLVTTFIYTTFQPQLCNKTKITRLLEHMKLSFRGKKISLEDKLQMFAPPCNILYICKTSVISLTFCCERSEQPSIRNTVQPLGFGCHALAAKMRYYDQRFKSITYRESIQGRHQHFGTHNTCDQRTLS